MDPNGNCRTNSCQTCSKPAATRCAKCHLVYYCSRPCQQKDWKEGGHKKSCISIQRRLIGNQTHIYTTKSFKAGEILWTEPLLVYSITSPSRYPKFANGELILCTICCKCIPPMHYRKCPQCQLPICPREACWNNKSHKSFECPILSKCCKNPAISTVSLKNIDCSDFLILLRILKLKKENGRAWTQFLSLNLNPQKVDISAKLLNEETVPIDAQFVGKLYAHGQNAFKKQSPRTWKEYLNLVGAIGLLVPSPEVIYGITVKELEVIISKMRWNSIEDESFVGAEVFPSHSKWIAYHGSTLNHSCFPNTTFKVDLEKNQIVFRARFDVATGEELTICRYPALVDNYTPNRRRKLFEDLNILCSCRRCEDPTELNSWESGYKCFNSSCPGFILPHSTLDPNIPSQFNELHPPSWECDTCIKDVPNAKIDEVNAILMSGNVPFMNNIHSSPTRMIELVTKDGAELIRSWTRKLVHPNHTMVVQTQFLCALELTYAVVAPPPYEIGNILSMKMKHKVELVSSAFLYWKGILDSNVISMRGWTMRRGIVLAGYYTCLAFIKLNGTSEQTKEFSEQLKNLDEIRVEAQNILTFRAGMSKNVDCFLGFIQDFHTKLELEAKKNISNSNSSPDTMVPVPLEIKTSPDKHQTKTVHVTQSFQAGNIIWTETPIVLGPINTKNYARFALQKSTVCFVCCREIPNGSGKECQKCQFMICSSLECSQDHAHRSTECEVFQFILSQGPALFPFLLTPTDVVLILRIMKLRDDQPESWKKFIALPSHPDKVNLTSISPFHKEYSNELIRYLRDTYDTMNERQKRHFIRLACTVDLVVTAAETKGWTIKDLDEILDRMIWNSVDDESNGLQDYGNSHMRWIAQFGSTVRHSCAPNITWKLNREEQLVFRALVDLKPGDELLLSRAPASLALSTIQRREMMFSLKDYSCSCPKCSDPTELGSFASALKCLDRNCTGNLLMLNPLESRSKCTPWKCDFCSSVYSWKETEQILTKLTAENVRIQYNIIMSHKTSVCNDSTLKLFGEAEQVVKKWTHYLHPNHELVCSLLGLIYSGKFSYVFDGSDKPVNRVEMIRLISQARDIANYCKNALDKQNVKCGWTRQRGQILAFYYSSLGFLYVNGKEEDKREFGDTIDNLDNIRIEAQNILSFYAPEDSFVVQILRFMSSSKEMLSNLTKDSVLVRSSS